MKKIRIAVAGASGRMGRRILTLAQADPDLEISGALERKGVDVLGDDVGSLIGQDPIGVKVTSNLEEGLESSQVLIDFTHPSATELHIQAALKNRVGLVIGTTGIPKKTLSLIKKASGRIPILQSPNMSPGVNFLFELVTLASKVLAEGYDIEITETHHRMKKDAPSGTALELARLITEAKKGTVPIHSLRGGDVVGDHTVSFLGDGEIIELVHRATSRDAFARGALRAAKFVARHKSGLYNMRDLLKSINA
ncbi:MAG: 4-hydroxy-tetrahydrodipicolinate reductase [Candidatus Omnitrophica bacterium]|nr:4-hydroxy-tetrahydrodipicolinate reductase [Candidatus Omnitrophota bacterium]